MRLVSAFQNYNHLENFFFREKKHFQLIRKLKRREIFKIC